MVGYVDLRDARLGAVTEAAHAWRLLARRSGELERQVVTELTGPLRTSGWSGDAASALFTRLDQLDDEFELAALLHRMAAIVLDNAAERLRDVQQRLHAAIDACDLLGLQVTDDGRVVPPPAQDWHIHLDDGRTERALQYQNAEIYTELIGKLLSEADDADADIKRALGKLEPSQRGSMDTFEWKNAILDAQEVADLLGVTESAIPESGTDPESVRTWWAGLTEDQRLLYLTAHPDRLGALDGLPTADRDEANRLALRAQIGELGRAPEWGPQERRELDRLLPLLDKLEAAEYGPPGQALFLLGLDNANDGKAIVAVGNPDTAAHTAVLVPGTGTELDNMRGQIDRAAEVQRAAEQLGGPTAGGVSVIAWLGYDAPGFDSSAVGTGHAEAGAPALDSFVNGLHAAHAGESNHTTVIGHSYGSVVVGEAASRGNGLAVDDIITAGSPGMSVGTAGDLMIDPRHVWAGGAADDPMTGGPGSIPGIHDNEPTSQDFGANRYHADTSGHSGYWTPGSESLKNQGRIVLGLYDQVSLDHGQAPR
ncbi:alpha/beta hydrolase [Plantactinospora sp. WMMB782]|uniref:alpha/beta hydrolase n=1 Tax=Plantactinospora sp. WMMB782 TaxID=3404121 RepID=UPI003B961C75